MTTLFISTVACGPSQQEYDNAMEEMATLRLELEQTKEELDEVLNGPDRLIALARASLERGEFEDVVATTNALLNRHPDSPHASEAESLAVTARTRLEAARAEEQRRIIAEREAEEARRTQALRQMRPHHDEVRNVTSYYDRNTSRYVNTGGSRMLLYIVQVAGGTPQMRFSLRYMSDSWLFVEGYTFRVDDRTFEIRLEFGDIERDNGSGGIWEWYDVPAGSRELEIVRAVIASERTILRYNGDQYYRDRTISAAEKQSLQNVLDAFDALSNL